MTVAAMEKAAETARGRYPDEPHIASGFSRLGGMYLRAVVFEYLKKKGLLTGPPRQKVENFIVNAPPEELNPIKKEPLAHSQDWKSPRARRSCLKNSEPFLKH